MHHKNYRVNVITEFKHRHKNYQSLLLDLPKELADKLETAPDGTVEPRSLIKALAEYNMDLKAITRH